jgi:hypothetical protein
LWWRGKPQSVKKKFMDKETLIKRLKSRAHTRKKQLFLIYGELISSEETAENIVAEIHADLGEDNLVNTTDIYYCRRHFMKNKRYNFPKRDKEIVSDVPNNRDSNFEDLTWTNPAELERVKLKSKFAK